ncbi:MAG TPA: hypothetical protein VNA12_01245 [Mycobacteriales bacterium]|nr:hypothetical protein [Mycobacteriales bacterium]
MGLSRRTATAVLLSGVVVAAGPATAQVPSGELVLPKPVGEIPLVAPEVVTPERRRTTFVPGPVRDDERIEVAVAPDGTPAAVVVTQRLELTGTGDFAIRERGPALRVSALEGTTAPIIQRGTVVWQGFVPGRRLLAARLTLDPAREALLLPLRLELSWTAPDGAPIAAGGAVPGPGRLVVRLANQTARPESLPAGVARTSDLVPLLDRLREAAAVASTAPPPAAGRGLPLRVPADGVGTRTAVVAAPLRVTGSVRVRGASGVEVSGAGARALPSGDGADVAGVLHGTTEVVLEVPGSGALEVDLTVVPALDPRRLEPPGRVPSWAAWAAASPDEAARRTATDVLVEAAAAAARADEVAPYLGHPGPGPTSTQFRYRLAPAPRVVRERVPLRPRPVPIALTATAVVALAAGAAAAWRRL